MVIIIKKRARAAMPSVAALMVYSALAWGVLTVAGLPGGAADAHAILEAITPAAGSTLTGPDTEFVLSFNSRLDHQRSRVTLISPTGQITPLPIALPAASPAAVTVHAQGLAPGAYVLHWQVLAVDGHMTRGNIPYTIVGQ
jgi:hypothetical protein